MVVMCQKPKLEMEAAFRRIIPPERRLGTRLVFRQGSPLLPRDLHLVAAQAAAATVIVSDSTRCGLEWSVAFAKRVFLLL